MAFDRPLIKVVVCDVDDTLVEASEDAKDAAWFPVFGEFPREKLAPVIKEAQQKILGGKGNRTDIARDTLLHFGFPQGEAKKELKREVERRCALFDAEVQSALKRIGVRPPVRKALSILRERFPLYVNTGIPLDVLKRTLQNLGIKGLFKEVYGTPGTKVENLEKIAHVEHAEPSELLFISDGQGDFEAAEKFGCQFIGIATHRNKWGERDGHERPETLVTHFEEVLSLVRV